MPLGFGQTDAPKPQPDQTTRVNVNEVSLNLVVRDHRGKLVTDIKPEDLSITDGGVPVKLSALRLVSGTGTEHLVTLVFDRMDSAGARNAREITAKILKMIPQGNISFAVMRTGMRLTLYQDFSSDRAKVLEAVSHATEEDLASVAQFSEAAEKRAIAIAKKSTDEQGNHATAEQHSQAQALLAALQESQRVLQELHTQPGLAGLLALSRTEIRMPGRKTVMYISQGFQSDANTEDRLHEIIGAANRAGVSIYPIDAAALNTQLDQGLLAMSAMGSARSARIQAGASPAFTVGSDGSRSATPQPPPGLAPMADSQTDRYMSGDPDGHASPLASVANSTGGAYVAAGADVKKSLKRMIEDMTTYYEASYVPPIQKFDGQFRPIAITPVRSGIKVSSRAGYFAVEPNIGGAPRPFELPLLKLLSQNPLPADLALQARVLHLGEVPNADENSFAVEVPIAALESKSDPNANLYSVHAAVVAQIRSKAGDVIEHFGEDIPLHGSLTPKEGRPEFITMQRHFSAAPGDYVLDAVVYDQNSGKAGARSIEFKIPEPATGPFLSDIAMVQRVDPVPAEADPEEPLRYGSGKVVPNVSGSMNKGTPELSFFFVVHPDASSADAPKLSMEVRRSGEPVAQVPLALRRNTAGAALPYLTSIQSGRLPAGDYQVVERLTQDGKSVERELAFRIEGPEESPPAPAAAPKEEGAASGLQIPETAGPTLPELAITALPPDKAPAPSPEKLQSLIEISRKRALEYSRTLPNFLCVERTNRSVDPNGNGNWRQRDSIAELLSYHDNRESRTTLEVNGRRSSMTRDELNSTWPLSVGEFGAILNLVFKESSKTEFEWKEAAALGDGSGTVQVLNFRVAPSNATIVLSEGNSQVAVGFHGMVYIDPITGGVRRVTLHADDLPKSFAVRAANMTVDYNFVGISGRDYLLPVNSSVRLERAHHKTELNEITFRNYRRFASRTKIKVLK